MGGTSAHVASQALPPLVEAAARVAAVVGFSASCLPDHGRLLALLAAGRGPARIGETGTGCGVRLAWLVHGAHRGSTVTSIDRDASRVAVATEVFATASPEVRPRILHGDWTELAGHGPFDMLVLDGGGSGKDGGPPLDVHEWLVDGGLLVIDDFTPFAGWPPTYDGRPDDIRLHWLTHDALLATEVQTEERACTLVARYVGGGPRSHG